MEIREKNGSCHVIKLHEGDVVQLLVPASVERTCVYLSVICGKLCIGGGASVIDEIVGEGMTSKVREGLFDPS